VQGHHSSLQSGQYLSVGTLGLLHCSIFIFSFGNARATCIVRIMIMLKKLIIIIIEPFETLAFIITFFFFSSFSFLNFCFGMAISSFHSGSMSKSFNKSSSPSSSSPSSNSCCCVLKTLNISTQFSRSTCPIYSSISGSLIHNIINSCTSSSSSVDTRASSKYICDFL